MDMHAWGKLALFMLTILAAALQGLSASGHFPAEHRKPALRGMGGTLVLAVSILVTLASVILAIYAARTVPWYALVIGGGGMLLLAPIALQPFPDRFVDGSAALVAFSLVAAISALAALTLPG